MQSWLGKRHGNRTIAVFLAQLIVLTFFAIEFLQALYDTASSEEAAFSFLFMPFVIVFIVGVCAATALPLLAAYAVHKRWAFSLAPLSLLLPMLLANAVRIEGASPLNISHGSANLLERLEWELPVGVWLVSFVTIGWLEYVIHQTSTHSGTHNEQL